MNKILTIISNFGYWGVELTGPMIKLEKANYELIFATPNGERPIAVPASYDTEYIDPPLGTAVTTYSDAEEVKDILDSPRLDKLINISDWMPERPYFSAQNFFYELQKYFKTVKEKQKQIAEEYAGLLIVGGSGSIIDVVNNQRIHDIILAFYKADLPIAAICYGVGALVFARDFNERNPIIRGKHVTGHCVEYDYHDGTTFVGTDLNMGPPPYCLEFMLRDAVGKKGQYHGNFGKETSVILDYPFLTARSLQCAHEFGEQFVNMLDNGLRRYGW